MECSWKTPRNVSRSVSVVSCSETWETISKFSNTVLHSEFWYMYVKKVVQFNLWFGLLKISCTLSIIAFLFYENRVWAKKSVEFPILAKIFFSMPCVKRNNILFHAMCEAKYVFCNLCPETSTLHRSFYGRKPYFT